MVLNIKTAGGNYPVYIERGSLKKAAELIGAEHKVFIVTDSGVPSVWVDCVRSQFPDADLFVFPQGEASKNLNVYEELVSDMLDCGISRNDCIIALGGGVAGDIAGFAASTYMRGIDYIQIPTTLLSMVDSSVGGKTAIDICGVKNIVGTFYQPKKVFVNLNFLKTLDKRQYYSGLGEVLKYAFIEKSCECPKPLFLFEYLTLCAEKLMEREIMTLARVIEYCLELKISVVNLDEKE
ncbi:MAG: 3-dehydroquinate synthase, partial [Firmicutes bacterium]|nr:3-dehydroquinate synthase [Bacillota bacterium]